MTFGSARRHDGYEQGEGISRRSRAGFGFHSRAARSAQPWWRWFLNGSRAIQVSVQVVRVFVRLRETIASDKQLARRLDQLERKLAIHDEAIRGVLKTLREPMNVPPTKKRPIAFVELQEKK